MTVSTYIKQATNPETLYSDIRAMLEELDKRGKYPEDWTIKKLQREADYRYEQLISAQQRGLK